MSRPASQHLDKPPIERFPYPQYRKAGIQHIDTIPVSWKTKRLKFLGSVRFSNVDKKSIEGQQSVQLCNYTDVYNYERITSDRDFMPATAPKTQIDRFTLKKSDVLITKDSETWDDIAVPALVDDKLKGVLCGYHLALIRANAKEADGAYLARAFAAHGIRDQFRKEALGITRFGLSQGAISGARFPLPSLPEQRAIAAFLDRETKHIDQLILEKEELIKLLEEKRTALISHAVTKGLNPNTKMKDSGVPWLGQIPKHWKTKRLKFLLMKRLQYGANESGTMEGEDMIRFVRITDVDVRGNLRPDTAKYLSTAIAESFLLKGGDILLARSGATVGKSFRYEESWGQACFAGYLILCRPNQTVVDSEYLYAYTKSAAYETWKSRTLIKATIENLSAEKYANLVVPLPPSKEQKAIKTKLFGLNESVNLAIDEILRTLTLLRERRTALISAAVTGKIDVRKAN